jgi:predicted TPR repeat methyltransferase
MTNPLSQDFFDAKYKADIDPWDFAGSSYEQTRYDEIINTLGARHFHRAFEPGCSIGVLTERLGAICDRVEASDISSVAVARARARCHRQPGVAVQVGSLPESIPEGSFDLIVLSEVGYYLAPKTLTYLARDLAARLTPDGLLLAAHWLGTSQDHVLRGDEVHEILDGTLGLKRIHRRRYEGFRVDLWSHL